MRLEVLHNQAYGITKKISLYRRMQRMGYYWPDINRDATTVQEECQKCWLSVDKEESYVVFVTKYWKTLFMEYLG